MSLLSAAAPILIGLLGSRTSRGASIKHISDPDFPDEIAMFAFGKTPISLGRECTHGKSAFDLGPISRYIPALKICAILYLALLALPQEIDPSSPEAFLWIFPGELWVWPLWLTTVLAYAAVVFIGGRGYDSFFANRYTYDRISSAWIRIRTSTDPAGEHRKHAVIMGIFVSAACFIMVETVVISGLCFAKLWVLDNASTYGNRQAEEEPSWPSHPVFRCILAGVPVIFCRMLIKKGTDLYHIGMEARTDRIENEYERRRYNRIRSRLPFEDLLR